jgi:hypothetical protein
LLLDKYLPRFDVRVRHSTAVPDDPDRTYAALRAIDLNRSRWIRLLFTIRSLPSRRRGSRPIPPPARPFIESATAQGWVVFEERPDRELVAGSITQPWKPAVEFRGLPAQEFVAFAEPGFAKIAWSFAVEPATRGSLVTLETRVLTTDPLSRRRFRLYWLVFSPGIKLVRILILGLLRRDLRRRTI